MLNQKPIIILKRCSPMSSHRNSLLNTTEPSNRIEMPVCCVVSKASNNEMQEAPTCASNSSNGATSKPDLITIEDTSRLRVTTPQLEFLAHCMERFPELAQSQARSKYDRMRAYYKWNQIANALNKIEPRVTKTGKKWLKYWINEKFKIRRKLAFSHQKSLQTGKPREPFTPFQERLVRIVTQKNQNDQEHKDYSMDKVETVSTEEEDVISTQDVTPIEEVMEPEAVLARTPSPTPTEDPIDTGKPSIEDLQAEILQFNLKRQKEMHNLEMSYMTERHKLEMEILELKKKRLLQELGKNNDTPSKKVAYGFLPKYYIKS